MRFLKGWPSFYRCASEMPFLDGLVFESLIVSHESAIEEQINLLEAKTAAAMAPMR